MQRTKSCKIVFLYGRKFMLILTAQGLSGFGSALRFIAITSVLFKLTGSGVSVSLNLAFTVIPAFIFASFAGNLGDMINNKSILIFVELIRAAATLFLAATRHLAFIYFLTAVFSILDVLYNPPYRKMFSNLTDENNVLYGNSLVNGINGIVNIAGSIGAGMLISISGEQVVFFIVSLSHAAAAFLLSFLCMDEPVFKSQKYKKECKNNFCKNMKEGINYFWKSPHIRDAIVINIFISFCTMSVNLNFYTYAFDIIKVDSRKWSIMISVFYGSCLIAMILGAIFNKSSHTYKRKAIFITMLLTATVWYMYGIVREFKLVLLLQIIEGTSLAFCNILNISNIQISTSKDYMSRVTGINDFICSIAKTAGIIGTFVIEGTIRTLHIFLINSILLASFALYGLYFKRGKLFKGF